MAVTFPEHMKPELRAFLEPIIRTPKPRERNGGYLFFVRRTTNQVKKLGRFLEDSKQILRFQYVVIYEAGYPDPEILAKVQLREATTGRQAITLCGLSGVLKAIEKRDVLPSDFLFCAMVADWDAVVLPEMGGREYAGVNAEVAAAAEIRAKASPLDPRLVQLVKLENAAMAIVQQIKLVQIEMARLVKGDPAPPLAACSSEDSEPETPDSREREVPDL